MSDKNREAFKDSLSEPIDGFIYLEANTTYQCTTSFPPGVKIKLPYEVKTREALEIEKAQREQMEKR